MNPIASEIDPSALQLPESIGDRDVACVGCGYNLRGLATAARCPECDTPNWLALVEKKLYVASPEWIDQLRRGLRWLMIAIGVLVALSAVAPFCGQAKGPVSLGAYLVFASLSFVAIGKLSTPNPIERPENIPGQYLRATWLRPMLLVSVAGTALAFALWQAGGYNGVAITVLFIASPVGVSGALTLALLAWKLERIASLAEDQFAEGRIRAYRRGFCIGWTISGINTLLANISPVFGCFGFFAGAVALGFAALIVLSPTYVADRPETATAWARQAREAAKSASMGRPPCGSK